MGQNGKIQKSMGMDPPGIEEARRRLAVIGPLLRMPRRSMADIRAASAALGVGKSTLYRWLHRYEADGKLTSLCPTKPPGGRGLSRLDPDVERIVRAVIEDYHCKAIQPTAELTMLEVRRRCRDANVSPPHKNTVRARLRAIGRA
jgi:putative transposase